MSKLLYLISFVFLSFNLFAQKDSVKVEEPKSVKWYESFSIRGYGQVRYNRLLETNPDLKCEQCDKSWGDDNGLSVRRMRVIL